MRTLKMGAALLLATVFAAGCSDGNAPSELSQGVFRPVFSQAPEIVTFPVAFTAFNPCIGADEDVSGTATLTIHFFELDTDPVRHHFNIQFRLDLETASGFSGFLVGPDVDNGTPEPGAADEEFSFTSIANVNLSNESGQRVKVHINFHITIRNGVVVRSFVDNVSFMCVGNPNG